MISFDKLKIISSIENVQIMDETLFTKRMQGGKLHDISVTLLHPYNLYIEVDYVEQELVLEFTGKVLGDDYPRLICLDTIKQCLDNINKLGYCLLDVKAILHDGDVCKADVTRDVKHPDCKALTNEIRANIQNFNKYLPRVIAGNFTVDKNVKTSGYKKRLTLYDKSEELQLAKNKAFLDVLADRQKMLDYFDGRVRFEMNLNTKEQIRRNLHISDTSLLSVLRSDANPIQEYLLEILIPDQDEKNLSSFKEYQTYLILQDNGFDLANVQSKLRQLKPNGGRKRDMAPFVALKQKLNSSSKSLRSKLTEMLS